MKKKTTKKKLLSLLLSLIMAVTIMSGLMPGKAEAAVIRNFNGVGSSQLVINNLSNPTYTLGAGSVRVNSGTIASPSVTLPASGIWVPTTGATGTVYNPFSVFFENAGETIHGEKVNVRIDCTTLSYKILTLTASKDRKTTGTPSAVNSSVNGKRWIKAFSIKNGTPLFEHYGCFIGGTVKKGKKWLCPSTRMTVNISLTYNTGPKRGQPISEEVWCDWRDIDQEDRTKTPFKYTTTGWGECVSANSGVSGNYYVAPNTTLKNVGNTFHATADDKGDLGSMRSAFIVKGSAVTSWTNGGGMCGTYFTFPYTKGGSLRIKKVSSDPAALEEGRSLQGAVYTLYSDSACTNAVRVLTTDANGWAYTDTDIPPGTYYLKETKSAPGFKYRLETQTVTIRANAFTDINASGIAVEHPLYESYSNPVKSADKHVVKKGDTYKYTITQQLNTFNENYPERTYRSFSITDLLPEELEYVSGRVTNQSGKSQNFVVNKRSVNGRTEVYAEKNNVEANGDTLVFTIKVRVKKTGTVGAWDNSAITNMDGKDYTSNIVPTTVETEYINPRKTTDNDLVDPGENYTYTIFQKIHKTGDDYVPSSYSTPMSITDELPEEVEFNSAQVIDANNQPVPGSIETATANNRTTVTWTESNSERLPLNGQTIRMLINVTTKTTVQGDESWINTAVTTVDGLNLPSNDVVVGTMPSNAPTKTADIKWANEGETFTYTITQDMQDIPSISNTQAYAVFDKQTNELTFFRDTPGKYANGETEGDPMTSNSKIYYTGFEDAQPESAEAVPWHTMRPSVEKITFKGYIEPVNTSYWFYDMNNMKGFNAISGGNVINFDLLNTKNTTSMKYMFASICTGSTTRSISLGRMFDTRNVADMSYMFADNNSLYNLRAESFITSNVTTMKGMFSECRKLEIINTGYDMGAYVDGFNFDTSNVTDMSYMFYQCQKIKKSGHFNLSRLDTSNVQNYSYMFYKCSLLDTDFTVASLPPDTSAFTSMGYRTTSQLKIGLLSPPYNSSHLPAIRVAVNGSYTTQYCTVNTTTTPASGVGAITTFNDPRRSIVMFDKIPDGLDYLNSTAYIKDVDPFGNYKESNLPYDQSTNTVSHIFHGELQPGGRYLKYEIQAAGDTSDIYEFKNRATIYIDKYRLKTPAATVYKNKIQPIKKTASKQEVEPGEEYDYTITQKIPEFGKDVTDNVTTSLLTITDTFPAQAELLSAELVDEKGNPATESGSSMVLGPFTLNTGAGAVNLTTDPDQGLTEYSGKTITITVHARANDNVTLLDSPWTNTATSTFNITGIDSHTINSTTTDNATVTVKAKYTEPVKESSKEEVGKNQEFTYTITQKIHEAGVDYPAGVETYPDFAISDPLPEEVEFVEARAIRYNKNGESEGQIETASYDSATRTVQWTPSTPIALNGGTLKLSIKVKAIAEGPKDFENQASTTLDGRFLMSNKVKVRIKDSTPIYHEPTKEASVEMVDYGQEYTYTITQPLNTNTEDYFNDHYTSFVFADQLPDEVEFKDLTVTRHDASGDIADSNIGGTSTLSEEGLLTWDMGSADIPLSGGSLKFTITVKTKDRVKNRDWVNTATSTIDGVDLKSNKVTVIMKDQFFDPVKETSKNLVSKDEEFTYTITQRIHEVRELPDITVTAQDCYAGDTQEVTATLPNDATGTVTFLVNDETYKAEVLGGAATIEIENIPGGIYQATALYGGNGKYLPNTADDEFTATKKAPDITIDASDCEVDSKANAVFTFPKNMHAQAVIKLDGATVYDDTPINTDGIVELAIPVSEVGEHSWSVTTAEDDYYLQGSAAEAFEATRKKLNITLAAEDIKEGETAEIIATVPKDYDGDITFTVDGQTASATASNGSATVDVDGLAAGEYTVTASGEQTDKYTSASTDTTFTVHEKKETKYAVSLYGIETDNIATAEVNNNATTTSGSTVTTKTGGLTFGPATGSDYLQSYQSHTPTGITSSGNAHRCIHDDDWDTIIQWNHDDPYVYEQCIDMACTHAVYLDLTATSTVMNKDFDPSDITGDGPSVLTGELILQGDNGTSYENLRWHPNNDHPQGDNSGYPEYGSHYGGWGATRIRAMLNGADSLTDTGDGSGDDVYSSYAETDINKSASVYTKTNSLLAAFPKSLRNAIGQRETKYDSVYNNKTSANLKMTYDKLWLLSPNEIVPVGHTVGDPEDVGDWEHILEGVQYPYFYDRFNNYGVSGYCTTPGYGGHYWLRSTVNYYADSAYIGCIMSGDVNRINACQICGVAPCFTLAR